ncbi:hypothetical protein [Streptomyces olivaceiscleroticus]|uniref:LPXTG cell wall anchor domain-containing protein n=1 Tax=Streptomyces olivaceiscleroticus TaxID=68245 RepID=A0ABN0ZYV9_9ACTN
MGASPAGGVPAHHHDVAPLPFASDYSRYLPDTPHAVKRTTLYTGPFAAAFPHTGDLSMFIAAGVAAGLYLLTYRRKPLWVRNGGAPAQPATDPAARTPDRRAEAGARAVSR